MALAAFERGIGRVSYKADGSVVTETDRAVESLLRERITSMFPDDGILGEEHEECLGSSGRRWIIDPIDGTEAFVHGVAEWCTLVAVEDGTGLQVGVIELPALGETVWAGRGCGAFLNGAPIKVAGRTELGGSYIATSDLDDWPDDVVAASRRSGLRPRTWGGGYGIALAVSGRVDAFVDYDLDVWDVAPAAVIAAEAGGRFCALDGSEALDRGSCLVSNEALQEPLLKIFTEE